jgi:hypothetical protein
MGIIPIKHQFLYLSIVEVVNFIFRLGVVFAIFGFLWGMIDIALRLLTASRQRTLVETYLIKGVKYLFLADVTFLFCLGDLDKHMIVSYQVVLGGIVLLMYFVGKLQNSQNRVAVFRMMGRNLPQMPKLSFNMKAEIGVIGAALVLFGVLWFYPWLATNAASRWFHESILSIEDAFFFGFIFKIIGFFFMLNMFFQMAGGITFLLNGGKTPTPNNGIDDRQNSRDDDFDDYEEVD